MHHRLTFLLLNSDDDTSLQTFTCLFFFLCHVWVLFVQFLMGLHLRCVYMKRLYKGKIKQYINCGSSGESLQCFQVVIYFQNGVDSEHHFVHLH